MARLLREIDARLWAKLQNDPAWEKGNCPGKILPHLVSNDGVSVWRFEEESEIIRIVAACAMSKTSIADTTYAVLEEDALKAMGVNIKHSKGDTLDDVVNDAHRDLVEINTNQADQIACLIRDDGDKRKFFDKDVIYLHAHASLKSEFVDGKKFFRHHINNKTVGIIEGLFGRQLLVFP